MDKEKVIEKVIKAITLIEDNPDQHFTDYVVIDALYQVRDYLIGVKAEANTVIDESVSV